MASVTRGDGVEVATFAAALLIATYALYRGGESGEFIAPKFLLLMPLGWVTGQLLFRYLGVRRVVREVGAILVGPFVFMFLFNLVMVPYYAIEEPNLLSLQKFLTAWLYLWSWYIVIGTLPLLPAWVALRVGVYGARRYGRGGGERGTASR